MLWDFATAYAFTKPIAKPEDKLTYQPAMGESDNRRARWHKY
jgi:hypothetical protein